MSGQDRRDLMHVRTGNNHGLVPALLAALDNQRRFGEVKQVCQKGDDSLVGLAIHRRRS